MEQQNNLGKQKYLTLFYRILALLCPAVLFYLMENYTHNPWTEVRAWAQFFNILLFFLAAVILFLLTGRLCFSLRILTVISCIFGLLNAYVVRFRTNPIVPWDIFSIRTAVSVADNYDFTPDVRIVIVTICFVSVFFALRLLDIRLDRRMAVKRLMAAAGCALLFAMFAGVLQQESFQNRYRLYNKLFTPAYMAKVDGIAVTLVMNMPYLFVDKPGGYEAKEAQELLYSYQEKEQTPGGELPNIIVVMNESFSDLSVLGSLRTNRDYMPFFHSMQKGRENTVTGTLNVSVCGGNTANTEFEFLTGHTMAFLPQGSIPYQQYVKKDMQSLVSHLAELGYETVAMHPYGASGWERDEVYPKLGFSRCLFKEAYGGAQQIRQYVSDAACVDKIISIYEEKDPDTPLFVFNVTMQNHGGYKEVYKNFTPDIKAEGIENISVEQYLSLLEESDAALEELVTYFASADEKTVVVFFGDHQPSDVVAAPVLAENGMQWNALGEEEIKLRYKVPYLIWANYEMESETGTDTSVNYLGAEVLKRSGVPTSGYQNFLLELREEYPVLSAVRVKKADGSETFAENEKEGLYSYRVLQYYQMFDE